MDRYRAYFLPAAAALVLLGYYAWRWSSGEPVAEPTPAKAPAAPSTKAAEPEASKGSAEPVPLDPAPRGAAPPAEVGAAGPERSAARDRAKRDALRDRIARAQRQRLGREPTPSDDEEALGRLPKEYIKQRVGEDLIPLAQECYGMALRDDEALAGRMVLHFRIVGEPELGGVVEEVQLSPDSDLTHPDLVECMSESMLSMTFDPPEGGGAVEVTYPFEFSPGEPEETKQP